MRKIIRALSVCLCVCLVSACGENASSVTSTQSDNQTESETTIATAETTITTAEATAETTAQTEAATTTAPITEEEFKPLSFYTEKAEEILAQMSLEEKVGQMFIARCPEENAAEKVTQYQYGGYTLYARDFENKTRQEVIDDILHYQENSKIPMLIGVDEEGGIVNRVSKFTEFRAIPFLSPQELFAQGGFELIESDCVEKCTLLRSLGINMNYAPVCDVSTSADDYINQRAFGQKGEETAKYVSTIVSTCNKMRVASVLKHFPGYGNNVDTHTGIALDKRDYDTFLTSDFVPFKAGMNAGASCVLVAHNIVDCMDEQYPASLSEKVHKILREELEFDGVIITDDLDMDAIKDYCDGETAAVKAVLAGNDMLVCTSPDVQYPAVLNAVNNGTISKSQVDQSVVKILSWKLQMGIIQ